MQANEIAGSCVISSEVTPECCPLIRRHYQGGGRREGARTFEATLLLLQKPRALLCEDSMCGRERDRKRRTDGHTSRCANAALSLACSGTSRGAGTIVFKATCGQNGTSGMEQLVAAAAYCQVAIGSANAHALS